LKTTEQVVPRGKDVKWSTLGVRRSKVKVTRGRRQTWMHRCRTHWVK